MKLTKNRAAQTDKIARVYDFLREKKTGVLATVGPDKTPHAVVLYYSVDKHLDIRFLTKKYTTKSDNLERNNLAVFVVYDEPSQTVVQITGEVREIKSREAVHEAFMVTLRSSLHTADTAVPPISRLEAGDHVAYELRPAYAKMSIYKHNPSRHVDAGAEIIKLPALKFSA